MQGGGTEDLRFLYFHRYLRSGSRTDTSEKCSDEEGEDCEPVPSFQSAFTHALMSADLNLNVEPLKDGK